MPEQPPPLLSGLTTLRVGGPARELVHATTESALLDAVRARRRGGDPAAAAGRRQQPRGRATRGSTAPSSGSRPPASTPRATTAGRSAAGSRSPSRPASRGSRSSSTPSTRGWVGVEALSGIPGSVGATPVQNVGAYGQEVADTIASVRTWDRVDGRQRTFAAADCGFGYRTSRFKQDPQRYVVLDVTFQLRTGAPVHAGALRRAGAAPRHRDRRPGPDDRRARGGAGAPARQGDGARRRRPRHLERRLVLHQPGPGPGRRPTGSRPTRRAGRSPTAPSRPAPPG